MLSYRHAFHAGNHADVLKHAALVLALDYLLRKETPLTYIDTHAGAGSYRLQAPEAQKTAEFRDGVGRLWRCEGLPVELRGYVDTVAALNGSGELVRYPGSPRFAAQWLRPQDRLRLFEMHPQDQRALGDLFGDDRRVRIEAGDGFAGLKALLPPLSRRALVLIDPPYEVKGDYRAVVEALRDAHRRFATGVYMLWYPLLDQADAKRLPARLEALGLGPSLRAERLVAAPGELRGLYGSGLFVINPPWQLGEQLERLLPWLSARLAQGQGGYRLRLPAGA
jgi:23S rRNA (adenine2030-N6)-methyltransferase